MAKKEKRRTGRFEHDTSEEIVFLEPQVDFRPIPDTGVNDKRPVWRVRFDLATDPSIAFGLDINGEVTMGRGLGDKSGYVDLTEYGAAEAGVSRRHAVLRPTGTKLFVVDLGSTNKTYRNGHAIGVRTPFPLNHGDTVTFGKLQFIVRIIERPAGHTSALIQKADLADALSMTAKAITSQLNLEDMLNEVAGTAMSLVSASEIGIWLVDQQSGELFLEAERGFEDETIKKIRIPVNKDSLAGQVIENKEPLRATRKPGEDKIKLKTNYLVEAVLYVPIIVAGEAIGVISATGSNQFTPRDEKLLTTISEFTAVAVQNSRIYQITDEALALRVEELAALNELSYAVSSTLDLNVVYDVLLSQIYKHWDVEVADLWMVDEQSGEIYSFSGRDGADEVGTSRSAIGEGIIGKVAKAGKSISLSGVQDNAAYNAQIDTAGGVIATSMAVVPLMIADTVVGVLALFNKKKEGFDERDIERLEAFSRPVATAIDNVRLYEQAQFEKSIVQATASSLTEPLLILSNSGDIIISNDAANTLLQTHMAQIFEGISAGVGQTVEIEVGEETYITTIQHKPELGTIVIMQDMTHLKKLERARTEFIHALSHDLKSPLTSIKGWADLLIMKGGMDEKGTQFVERIQAAAMRILGMIGQLLDVAMLSDLTLDQDAVVDLVEAITTAVSDVEGAALVKNINLEYKLMGEPYQIYGDQSRLYRCALNLLDNAIKYSPEGSNVWMALTFWGGSVTIQVRDDGPGIPEEDLPHVFEKFFRGAQTEGPAKGVGMGLSTVKGIIESHGGMITAENADGHGAEFTITLNNATPVPKNQ